MHRIILDTDVAMGAPGSDIDDGFAMALAVDLADQSLELVTTVNGNTDVETATVVALDLLDRLGRPGIPVVKGAPAPLLRPLHDHPARDRVAGLRERLGGRAPAPGRAATAIIDHVLANPGEISLVAIGPLTNVAVALILEPSLSSAVKEIVVMGGVFLRTTSRLSMPGEFNIWIDPEAAAIVLNSGAHLRFIGLDVTLQVQLSRCDADRLQATGRPFASYAGRCANAWIDYLRAAYPRQGFDHAPMHDPLAVAVVSRPQLVTWRPARVVVEACSDITRGVTVADLLVSHRPPQPNCLVATEVDSAAFIEFFLNHVYSL
ncbi:nucleoside hydrolase [Actinoplanes teichomyceticus]|uniref:Purine nucleosidase n=1 Tax=Actinoplanes teichomyceticus TaxID=1867 RepID=A0A561WBC4_ACTTI|nr:nucleoside hydrolase [Actinoplanes teichomyceticus]TWG21162.1 purine nucleosidase [Actinoplanes teichomyceticus]GIF14984.1 nucleoside hydrolase [Actinoplanes teichomyceticus]